MTKSRTLSNLKFEMSSALDDVFRPAYGPKLFHREGVGGN